MTKPPSPLPSPLPADPTPAFLEVEYARTTAYLKLVGEPGTAAFDEGELPAALDRLYAIKVAMPPSIVD